MRVGHRLASRSTHRFPRCRAVGFLGHDLLDQPLKGGNPAFAFAAPMDLRSPHVPRRQGGPSALTGVLVLYAHRLAGSRRQRGMPAPACLEAGLLVGREDAVLCRQVLPLPEARVEVQDPSCFLVKLRVAGEDPAAMAPGTQGVVRQPTPQRGLADGGDQTPSQYLALDVRHAQPRQRPAMLMGQLARQGFNGDHHAGGGKRAGRPLRGRSSKPQRRRSKKRLRHLLMICRGVSNRAAICSLLNPSAA